MRRLSVLRLTAVGLIAGALVSPLQAQFTDLVNRVPDQANALIAINLETALASPLAQRQGWAEDRQKAFESGMTPYPPETKQLLLASQLDLEFMQPLWEVAMLRVSTAPSMADVAAKWGGTVDVLGGRDAIVLPEDTYLVQFGPTMVGAMSPANRQNVSRWLQRIDENLGGRLSPYLKEAISYANQGNAGTPIIMALDLQDVISPAMVKQRASQIDALKDKNVNIDRLAELLSSAKGATLGITVKERVYGRLKVDFEDDVSALKGLAKPLLLEILANNSATIDEFHDWTEKVTEKEISIGGYLDKSGLRRLMSLIEPPAALQHSSSAPSTSPGDEAALQRNASQLYFKQVTGYIEDLRDKPNRSQAQTFSQVGSWIDRYARKIDKLPMMNVDPELLDYGAFVSDTMRAASDALKGIAGKTRVRSLGATQYSTVAVGRAGRWGGWGGYASGVSRYDTQRARTEISAQERVGGTTDARQIMRELESATTDIRRKMVQKYNVEF